MTSFDPFANIDSRVSHGLILFNELLFLTTANTISSRYLELISRIARLLFDSIYVAVSLLNLL